MRDPCVSLEGVDQVHQAGIVQSAGGEVELLEHAGARSLGRDNLSEIAYDFITQEILITDESVEASER